MARYPRRSRRPRRRALRRMRRRALRPMGMRKAYQGIKYFTETFSAGQLPNGGGWFVCAINSMANAANYTGLFDLGTILRYDVLLVPRSGDTVYGTSPATGRITFTHTQNVGGTTGFFPAVPSEIALLQESACKIVPLDGKRSIRMSCYRPKCETSQFGLTPGGVVSTTPFTVDTRKTLTWLNLNNTNAVGTLFGGIKYWISNSVDQPQYDVFIKVYAAFKEQQ